MPDDNVINFPGITRWDLPVERVIDNIPKDMEAIVVIGWDADGDLYAASNKASGPEVLWLLEQVKLKLLTIKPDY